MQQAQHSTASGPGTAGTTAAVLSQRLPLSLFAVVASRIRMEILGALLDRPSDVSSLADRLDLAGDLVSYHLRQLRRHRLVGYRREKTRRIYSLSPDVSIRVDEGGVRFEVEQGALCLSVVSRGQAGG